MTKAIPTRTQTPQNVPPHTTPLSSQLITKTNVSPAQAASRKLIQKSVKLLNAPRLKTPDKTTPVV